MKFRILGSLEVLDGTGERIALQGTRERKVLVTLLLNPNSSVAPDRLVAALWDDIPPTTAVKQVRNAVSRLRAVIASPGTRSVIETDGPGYVLKAGTDELDALAFEAHVDEADRAEMAGSLVKAAASLRLALDLWRGPALSGLCGQFLQVAAHGLEERRTMVAERYYDHQLALGRHQEVAGELGALVDQHPFRERLVAQLMLALFHAGRQVEALQRYGDLRRRLAEELGLDPGQALQRLHQQILTRDPDVSMWGIRGGLSAGGETPAAATCEPVAALGAVTPRQLPSPRRHFVGRRRELAVLNHLTDESTSAHDGAVLVIDGPAGVGKTALALHWAHQIAAAFPDGQLYVNLRGFDAGGPAISPDQAIRGFLEALGVPPHRVATSFEAQIGQYRSLIAGRRILVVMDNAVHADQVRPLLPGSVGCLALVTSRTRLVSLAAVEGAHIVTLDMLSSAEAREMLLRRLGSRSAAAERAIVDEVIRRCGRLPLALAIAAARAACQPGRPLSALAQDLREGNLESLSTGDDASDIRVVFAQSYEALSPPAARLFRLMGVGPGGDLTTFALAILAGVSVGAVRPLVTELVRGSLLSELEPDRYAIHGLLHAYASELATTLEPQVDRQAARHRLMKHLLRQPPVGTRLEDGACREVQPIHSLQLNAGLDGQSTEAVGAPMSRRGLPVAQGSGELLVQRWTHHLA